MNNRTRVARIFASVLFCGFTAVSSVSLAATSSTTPNTTASISALQSLSESGDMTATVQLADAYRKGNGVDKDTTKAFALYSEAARAGDSLARFRLGKAYHRGEGTDSNQISAWVWLTLATEKDSAIKEQAMTLRDTVGNSLTQAQQDRAKLLVTQFKKLLTP